MRPLRLLLLLCCFIALPILLTCLSLRTVHESAADSFNRGDPPSRLHALFSFHTPSSLFPPSAIISLTYDNSTFFLARPAAFGPSLPNKGLNGQLWVGRGFGDEVLSKDGQIQSTGWELGCSDVPGWFEDRGKMADLSSNREKQSSKSIPDGSAQVDPPTPQKGEGNTDQPTDSSEMAVPEVQEDGTDDYLHRPLPDSNPAKAASPGEPAKQDAVVDKTVKATHADIESLQESAHIAGKIVMLSRGGCGFLEKVKWAQRRGAIALIVGDNEQGAALTIMYAKGDTSNVTIPAIFTSYTSAHLLSSLVPPEHDETDPKGSQARDRSREPKKNKAGNKVAGPTFTSVKTSTTPPGSLRPTIVPANSKQLQGEHGWTQNVLAALGLGDDSQHHLHTIEDSRRPPSSGNIDWVLVEDWDDEDLKQKTAKSKPGVTSKTPTSAVGLTRTSTSASRRPTGDDFVIGVQDWRDTDLVAPKSSPSQINDRLMDEKSATGKQFQGTGGSDKAAQTGALEGGSITPGSGEYDHQKPDDAKMKQSASRSPGTKGPADSQRNTESWLKFWRWGKSQPAVALDGEKPCKGPQADGQGGRAQAAQSKSTDSKDEHDGLWVTLTPSSVSTSPFFDTLLVLVVSPLVTLTLVYTLLLLRSRIRRRRWRAPKSVVERLPVRTYHTIPTSSSTTSSQVATPHASSPTTPLLRSVPQDIQSRSRPRSQTTTGIVTSSMATDSHLPSHPTSQVSLATKGASRKSPKPKRYTGRQVECVVCLEEYVDGESKVMSLPCGHEFHAECITPWLVTRRRTCPICKGDVVRSLAKNSANDSDSDLDRPDDGDDASDDIQDRAAHAPSENPPAAMPVPVPGREDDVERGQLQDLERPERQHDEQLQPAPRSSWRNIISSSIGALSGETVWRNSEVDRSR